MTNKTSFVKETSHSLSRIETQRKYYHEAPIANIIPHLVWWWERILNMYLWGSRVRGKRLRMSMEWFCEREGNVMLLLWLDTGKRNNVLHCFSGSKVDCFFELSFARIRNMVALKCDNWTIIVLWQDSVRQNNSVHSKKGAIDYNYCN